MNCKRRPTALPVQIFARIIEWKLGRFVSGPGVVYNSWPKNSQDAPLPMSEEAWPPRAKVRASQHSQSGSPSKPCPPWARGSTSLCFQTGLLRESVPVFPKFESRAYTSVTQGFFLFFYFGLLGAEPNFLPAMRH